MLLAFNKPYGVICQFSPSGNKPTLNDFINIPAVYPAGRLDTDSEGLLLLTDNGRLQAQIADPRRHIAKTYWVQVEGTASAAQIQQLMSPLDLGDFIAAPARRAMRLEAPKVAPRLPPIRHRASVPTDWLCVEITEGKNRQVRRMTAKVGLPTLRLIRVAIGELPLSTLQIAPGEWRKVPESAVFGGRTQENSQLWAKKTVD
jgi:23S rRNA pseudouridine2457 synthase